ncbi:head GIN domain-containing protein [Pedobacter jeongneungensis]|uniref:head GIN domain-containing protein n=1 Tax=Pedobacter jeongneungensis TaxID=947309 RepID=UPI0004698CEE|nr:head GIN domain-containing protein [Pedobacter jeongneungensis]
MKKVFAILLASLTLTAGINAIAKDGTRIIASSKKNDDRDVKNFNGIASAGPINVIVTLGNTESCRLEGDAEALASIITEVKGNVLVIRPKTSITSWSRKYESKKITAYVTAKELASLTVSGDGNLTVNGKISTGSLTTTVSGSGNIKATANVDDYSGVISGSGAINITGGADRAKVVISSSGTFAGKSFSTKTLTSTISGSGTVNIAVSESIRAVISGSGSVNYSGNPTVDKTVIGSGGVRKV